MIRPTRVCWCSTTRPSISRVLGTSIWSLALVGEPSCGGPGFNLITALWSDGDRLCRRDDRVYNKAGDSRTENDHFAVLLAAAKGRGLKRQAALFVGWYASDLSRLALGQAQL